MLAPDRWPNQAALYGIAQMEALGLELLEVRRTGR